MRSKQTSDQGEQDLVDVTNLEESPKRDLQFSESPVRNELIVYQESPSKEERVPNLRSSFMSRSFC